MKCLAHSPSFSDRVPEMLDSNIPLNAMGKVEFSTTVVGHEG